MQRSVMECQQYIRKSTTRAKKKPRSLAAFRFGRKCRLFNLDVAGCDRLKREIGRLVECTRHWIALRRGIIIPKEGPADLIYAFAGFAIVLYRKINGVDQARVIRSSRQTPK